MRSHAHCNNWHYLGHSKNYDDDDDDDETQLDEQFSGLRFVSLGPFTVFMFVFLCYLVILHVCCIIVTRSHGPGGIEA